MAHVRGIKHIVNAIGNQQRLIVHLDCGHNMSVSSRQIADSGLGLEYHLTADQAICPFCPDPPPTPAMTLKHACPKCGYHANENTWRGPVYKPGIDAGRGTRIGETLEYSCEGCGFKTTVPCKDVRALPTLW